MPNLARYVQQYSPSGRVGPQEVNPQALTNTGAELPWRGVEAAGGAVAGLSDTFQKVQDLEDETAVSTSERQAGEYMAKTWDDIANEPDWTRHQELYSTAKGKLNDFAPKGPRAARIYGMRMDSLKPGWDGQFNAATRRRRIDSIDADTTANMDLSLDLGKRMVEAGNSFEAEHAMAQFHQAADLKVTAGIWTPAQAAAAKEKASQDIAVSVVWADGMDIMKSQGIEAAEQHILDTGLTVGQKNNLIGEIRYYNSVKNREKTAISDEANKQLTDMMIGRTLSSNEVQRRRSSLSESDYQSWAKIAISPVDKPGNIVKATELKTLAMDVWRGSLSRTDAEIRIRDSLADPTGINDKQYEDIYGELNREVKAYQAQDMKGYSIEATRIILGKDAGVMSFDALGNMTIDINKLLSPQDEFERKMHFVDIYNKQMSDYLADNPKASKKEMYVKSQELKSTYLAASKGQQPVTENIVNITTDSEWTNLKSGQRFKGPDGVVRVK